MNVKLINIVETIINKQDVYYRVSDEEYGIGQIIRQRKENRSFNEYPSEIKEEMENLLEQYKPKSYPSRLNCNFVFESLDDAKKFKILIWADNRPTYKVKIIPKSSLIRVDSAIIGNLFNQLSYMHKEDRIKKLIKNYWTGKPNDMGDKPLWEILFNGDVQIIERIENA